MNDSPPSVTIVGAGIAGMSAALRLTAKQCAVTVLEKSEQVGGQFGAKERHTARGALRYDEHAFHIFADWCQNFFAICEEIGIDRNKLFDPRPAFLTLEPLANPDKLGVKGREAEIKGREPEHFRRLEFLGAPEYFWKNANSGVAHWSDMVLYQYSVLDFLTDESFDEEDGKEFLNRLSVNGFMRTRRYASDMAALLHHELLLKVFAVPSYRTSARAYQTYLRHSAAFPPKSDGPDARPNFWAMRGNVFTSFWKPFRETLDKTGRFTPELNKVVTAIRLTPRGKDGTRKVSHIRVGDEDRKVDQLLLAVPFGALNDILKNSPELVEAAPELLGIRHLEAMPVPALNIYFNKPLVFPEEHVTLLDLSDDFYNCDTSLARKNGIASEYGLSVVDNSRLWPELAGRGKTVLSVLASDAKALLDETDEVVKARLIETLRKYIRFTNEDIDDSGLEAHRDEPLFVNSDGSWEYRPEARLDEDGRKFPRLQEKVSNLFLAGDYCRSKVDITSLEGAIVTGISAAHLIYPGAVAPPIPPRRLSPADRDGVRRSQALLEGWIDLAAQRAKQNYLTRRQQIKDAARPAAR